MLPLILKKYLLSFLFALYLIGMFLVYDYFQYSIGIDGSSYVTIAQKICYG